MMRTLKLALLLAMAASPVFAQVDHSVWNQLLDKHVNEHGNVSYTGFRQDSALLYQYLNTLSENAPTDAWSTTETLAYWINVYNAFTVHLVASNLPIKSIKDIKQGVPFVNSVWDIRFITIGDKRLSLNHIEHEILRKEFNEPRIHFAIVCASRSCPKLRKEAYVAHDLERQLHQQTIEFMNNPEKNNIGPNEVWLSPIFKWFRKDFTKNMTLMQFVSQYAERTLSADVKINYTEYDWSLNGE